MMNNPHDPVDPQEPAFRYVHSENIPTLLATLRASLLVSTYQAGKLVVVRQHEGRLSTLLRSFEQAMGLAIDARRLAIGTRRQIWLLRNAPDIAAQLPPAGRHDACYVARSSHVTGDIRVHELAWGVDELWLVNTRFSCLATLDNDYSFVPRWKPPFVSALAAEDRCHLNGLAMSEGRPRYVTALGQSDTPGGWRDDKIGSGCLLEVPGGQTVTGRLCMPHSPRLHQQRLYLLNSGQGEFGTIDLSTGRYETIAQLPGYTRGLALYGGYAFVGLSKIRETAIFGGLPVTERQQELKCGVWIVHLASGRVAGLLEFQKGVEEIFDVQVLPGTLFPAVLGFEKDTLDGTFVVPSVVLSP